MRITRSSPLLAVLLALSGPAFSQDAENEVELEGTITDMECVAPIADALEDCTRLRITVLGTEVFVDQSTPIITPTADLTGNLYQLLRQDRMHGQDPATRENPIPGSSYKGFSESSTIVTGVSNADGSVIADNVWVDIKENVILGLLQRNVPAQKEFIVQGTHIVLVPAREGAASFPRGLVSYDARMPGLPVVNDYGIRIRPGSIQEGTLISGEGYHDEVDNIFYAWLLEVSGGTPVQLDVPQVSILRAQCRVRGANEIELEVLGGSYAPAGATVRVFAPAGRATNTDGTPTRRVTTYGQATAAPDADDPTFGLYDFDVRQAPPAGTTGCPTGLRVEMLNPPVDSRVLSPGIFSVDVR